MKQLYIIGISVAVLLLVLLGLNKLTLQQSAGNADQATNTDVTTRAEQNATTTMTNTQQNENTTVVLKTNKGDITIELFTKDMPITAGNFLKLAQEDFYDGTKFHRVIQGFMIQGGDPLTKDDTMKARWGTGGPGYAIEDEFVAGYSNVRGTIAMANAGPQTGGSQFFINVVDNVGLDFDKAPATSKHPVFGRVIDGMDVVDEIANSPTDNRDMPLEPIVLEDVRIQQRQ